MVKTFFEFEDADGDVVTVETSDSGRPDDTVFVDASGNGVYLTRAAVDRLRAALAPYGTVEAAKPATDIVEGREYRLLPGACIGNRPTFSQSEAVVDGVTRVGVVAKSWDDDSYTVTGLDGRHANDRGRYVVGSRYLAPLTAEPAPITAEIVAVPDPLDPRRVAAWHKARELAGSHADTYDVLRLTEFLLYGEAA